MSIQSISIVVPTKGCVNKCKFCVSCMHDNPYENQFDEIQYRKRVKRAVIERVPNLIITGTGEALQNKWFLDKLHTVLMKENHPFPNVEIQTTGVMLMEQQHKIPGSTIRTEDTYPNIELLKKLGVNTISLSVSDIFDSDNNWNIIGAPKKLRKDLPKLCKFIKDQGFNLRLSLNMTNAYDKLKPFQLYLKCHELGADQITLRKLYYSEEDPRTESDQTKWVKKNSLKDSQFLAFEEYIAGKFGGRELGNGKPLYRLPFGAMVYSYEGMSIAIDDNCMGKNNTDDLKYIILRENGKLYCQWDDEGSLLF